MVAQVYWICAYHLAFCHSDGQLFFLRHIPKPKATTVADTPENQRLAENTKLQSNVNEPSRVVISPTDCAQVLPVPLTIVFVF
jgi:hypothetical protein